MFRIELPECFTGEDGKDFSQWVKRFEIAAAADPSVAGKLHILLPSRLSASAFTVWESLSKSEQEDFSVTKKKLSAIFGRSDYLATFQSCVSARMRQPDEPIAVYAAAITTLVEAAFPTYESNAKEGEKFRRFIAGLSNFLQVKIHESTAKTFQEAVDVAIRVERAHLLGQVTQKVTPSATVAATQEPDVLQSILHRLDDMEKKFTSLHLSSSSSRSHSPTPDQEREGWRQPSRHRSPSPAPRRDAQRRHSSPQRSSRPRSPSPGSRYGRTQHHPPSRSRTPSPDYYRRRSPSPARWHDYNRLERSTSPLHRYRNDGYHSSDNPSRGSFYDDRSYYPSRADGSSSLYRSRTARRVHFPSNQGNDY